jgi:DNA adenine methylase
MQTTKIQPYPFVKWAGGKRQLLEEIEKRMPDDYERFFEPFLGGGAVLFHLLPENAIINDINTNLIHTYKTIRDNVEDLLENLEYLDNIICDKEMYYIMRNEYNTKIINEEFDVKTAALFIYLNKRCFNGLYRVNSKGLFNVPFNNKTNAISYDKDNLESISEYLKNIEIRNEDFEKALSYADKGDFVFLDSPYVSLKSDTFENYTKDGFDLDSHRRLAKVFRQLDKKGCYLMLTNHNTPLIDELYSGYTKHVINVKRMINSDPTKRTGQEVIITNYEY